jgi:hypothetical protein
MRATGAAGIINSRNSRVSAAQGDGGSKPMAAELMQ